MSFQRELDLVNLYLWNLNIVTIARMSLTLRNCFKALPEIAAQHSTAISRVVLKRAKGLSIVWRRIACTYVSFKVLGILLDAADMQKMGVMKTCEGT